MWICGFRHDFLALAKHKWDWSFDNTQRDCSIHKERELACTACTMHALENYFNINKPYFSCSLCCPILCIFSFAHLCKLMLNLQVVILAGSFSRHEANRSSLCEWYDLYENTKRKKWLAVELCVIDLCMKIVLWPERLGGGKRKGLHEG